MTKWVQEQAIDLCRKLEVIAPKYGCHVALTGGTLYHYGERKDADILFYRIRQISAIDVDGLMAALSKMGVTPGKDFGWCYKATYEGRKIDFFFPERAGDQDYPRELEEPPSLRDATDKVKPKELLEEEITF